MIAMSINQAQEEIITELSVLNGDIEKVLCYILELGKQLPAMPEVYRNEQHLIKGCHSNVWLGVKKENSTVFFYADSDTIISRGLVSLLVRVCNGHTSQEILGADLYFIHKQQLSRFIGTKRSAGFSAMIEQIRYCCSCECA